ncbi:MAG: CHASE3 domain-containing protein [Pseudomonadota bacterium]
MAQPAKARRIQFSITLLLLGGLLLFVLVAISGYQTLQAVAQTTALRAQARESLLQSRTVMGLLKDVETGQRGFILTGDPAYLEPYESGLAQIGPAYDGLAQRLATLSIEIAPTAGLRQLIDRRLALARRNVEIRRQIGFDAAQALVMSEDGRRVMDAIRARFEHLDRLLRSEIERRNRRVVFLTERAFWSAGLLTGLGIVLTATAFILLQREQRRRARAERALSDANAHLEEAVAARTAELVQARSEIEAFALRLDRGIESERRRLAREVHDQLGQVFTALRMTLNHGLKNAAGIEREAGRMDALLGEGIATARRIAGELRPPLLDDLGLGAALAHKAQRFAEQSGVPCTVQVQDDARLSPEQATQLYRIVQEALTNVARHAGARQVWIAGEARDGRYWLAVEDDGRGMSGAATVSLGLLSMRERAALAGGRLELGAGRAGGVRVRVGLPLQAHEETSDANTHC